MDLIYLCLLLHTLINLKAGTLHNLFIPFILYPMPAVEPIFIVYCLFTLFYVYIILFYLHYLIYIILFLSLQLP